jgi:hypothetical protein
VTVTPARRILVELWPAPYAVAKLNAVPARVPARSPDGPPLAIIVGHGEITFIGPEDVVDSLAESTCEISKGWRLLTLDTVFPLDTIGVLRAVSAALADVGVPVMVLSSHDTDHFLVPAPLVGRALAALHQARLERLFPRE